MQYSEIAEGKHKAHLVGVQIKNDKNGKPFLSFTWQLEDVAVQLKSVGFVYYKDGSRNDRGINNIRAWAKGWDGVDLEWFERATDFLETLPVEVNIKQEVARDGSGRIYANITFVAPLSEPAGETAAKSAAETPANPMELPQHKSYLPHEGVQPNMLDVWQAFQEGTEDMSVTERDILWVDSVRLAVPNKDQDLFTEEDWAAVIRELKGE